MEIPELPPVPKPIITAHASKILNALKGTPGEWQTRRDIARAIGKNRLTPYDMDMLQRLCDVGFAKIARRRNETPIGWEWVYQAVSVDK